MIIYAKKMYLKYDENFNFVVSVRSFNVKEDFSSNNIKFTFSTII